MYIYAYIDTKAGLLDQVKGDLTRDKVETDTQTDRHRQTQTDTD